VQPQDSHDVFEETDVFSTPIKPTVLQFNDVGDTPTTIQLRDSCKDEYKIILNDYLAYRQGRRICSIP